METEGRSDRYLVTEVVDELVFTLKENNGLVQRATVTKVNSTQFLVTMSK